MTTTSTDVQSAFQYYINYAEGGKLCKITYNNGTAGNVDVENTNRVDFNYSIGDANSLNVDSINTKKIIMPITNKDGSTNNSEAVTITAIADEIDEDGSPLPSLNLDL